ncbi:MAG: ABC transporter substrate-binding protein [Deltaproteobacteria bacterium]|nr:ABC transporter substrate-binding protein [Deltaproteobacteria bacterium]
MPHRGRDTGEGGQECVPKLDSPAASESIFGYRMRDHDASISRRDFVVGVGLCLSAVVMGVGRANAVDKARVKVGFIIPEQGPLSQESKSLITGFEFFLKEKGSRPLEILRKDSGPDDQKTLEALTGLLVNQKVDFLVGPPSLNGSEKTIHGLAGTMAILFVTNPSVRLVAGEMCLPGIFRLRPNTYQAVQPLAPWAVRNIGLKAFITGEDDPQGNEEADFFAYAFEKSGGTFADRVMLNSSSEKLKTILDGVENTSPDFVFASFRQKSASTFLKAVRSGSSELKRPLIGPESLTAFPGVLSVAGKASTGVRTLSCVKDPTDFADRLKRETGTEVSYVERAAEGYDIAHIIYQATVAGPDDAGDPLKLVKFVEDLSLDGPRGRVRFDKNHEPIVDMVVQEWQPSGRSFERKVVQELGPCRSLDFGCGQVGFPKKPESGARDEEVIWDDQNE